MKKILVLITFLFTSTLSLAGTIGENFEPAAYSFGGIAIYSSDSDTGWESLWLSPSVTFYPKQNVAFFTGFSYQNYGNNDDMAQYFSLRAGGFYVFGYDANAQTGLVHQIGASGSRATRTTPDGIKSDAAFFITPYYEADYFLTERISLYGRMELVNFNLSTGAETLIDPDFTVSGGISIHFPNSFRDWSKITGK